MENIDVSKWVKSALVIDDKWGEVKDLIRMLNANGVSTSYYNPNPERNIDLEKLGFSGFEGIEGKAKDRIEAQLQDFMRVTLRNVGFDLQPDSITGYNLIFLDIELGFEEAGDNVKYQISRAVRLLRDSLKKESSSYGVVLWSHEPKSACEGRDGEPQSVLADVVKLLYNGSLKDKPKPLFVIDLQKSSFKKSEDFALLADKLNKGLQQNKIAKFFAYWNKEVLQSADLTCKEIQESAESLMAPKEEDGAPTNSLQFQNEFFNLLKYVTYAYFGFPRKRDDDISDILSRYSFSYMASQLSDKLQNHFSQKKNISVFDDHTDHLWKDSLKNGISVQECHNKFCRLLEQHEEPLDEDTQKKIEGTVEKITTKYPEGNLHKVIAQLNYNALFAPALGDIKELPGLVFYENFKNEETFDINITPPCDIAQNRGGATLYLKGKIKIFTAFHDALAYFYDKSQGERFIKTPPSLFEPEKYVVLRFDLKGVSQKRGNPKTPAKHLLKDSFFTELMQKFGFHNTRLGARTFN